MSPKAPSNPLQQSRSRHGPPAIAGGAASLNNLCPRGQLTTAEGFISGRFIGMMGQIR